MSKTASEQIVEMFSKDFKSSLERQRQAAEHQHLKDAVVEAAKKWLNFWNNDGPFFSDTALAEVIIELNRFESSSTKEK